MVGEVEAQAIGLDQRALLADVGAQPRAENMMHEVRGAVIALDVTAARGVHGRVDSARLEVLEGPADDGALLVLANAFDGEVPALSAHPAGVAHLSA